MSRPRVLIEQWLPVDQIGAECMRERGASSALPPLYFLHVWWARRPLTVSRAAILSSLLPAYPTEEDNDARPWPKKLLKRFPTFDAYKQWFLELIGILGNPAASKRIIDWAKAQGIKLTPTIISKLPMEWKEGLPKDMGVSIPYGYKRAFTYNPSEEQLETLYDLLEWTWGTREITFCDPMSGGGSIPFEALRFGLTVHANELNPVASVVLKTTLDYPARLGLSLAEDVREYGKLWCERSRIRLEDFYPLASPDENIFAYIWARTVACPTTGKVVPLSPNWWLRKGADPVAVKLITDPAEDKCRFEIVKGAAACRNAHPDQGTVKRGTGLSPWTREAIDGDYIKAESKAGRLGLYLYAVGVKENGGITFRSPTKSDQDGFANSVRALKDAFGAWEARGLIPMEPRREGRADWACEIYGIKNWAESFSPRQLLSHLVFLEELRTLWTEIDARFETDRAAAIKTLLAFAFDKGLDRNAYGTTWIYQRGRNWSRLPEARLCNEMEFRRVRC
jgi:putative DNA methylase